MSPVDRPDPATRGSYKHFRSIPTRWYDNDVYQHINNIVYYAFFDTVINGYLMSEGGLNYETSAVVGLAIETHCQFHRPIRFPQTVEAALRVAKLGNSSVRYEIGIFVEAEDECAAHGHFVHVFVNRSDNRPVPIPSELRRALERLLV
jgi:acyl-CoA thioester hydrolase